MDGGPSKVNPPNSHPSNPIHKAAKTPGTGTPSTPSVVQTDSKPPNAKGGATYGMVGDTKGVGGHDLNKIALTVGAVVLVGLAAFGGLLR